MRSARLTASLNALLFVTAWWAAGDALASSGSAATPVESAGPVEDLSPQTFSMALGPLEQRLFAETAGGRLDRISLLEAALIASGVDDAAMLRRYVGQMADRVEELRRRGAVRGTSREQAQAVFEFLHAEMLTGGYHLECTDLRQALDTGRFNCVSATVLFNCLASQFGLSAAGLEAPGHALSRLRLNDGPLDVETTCPRWFQSIGRSVAGAGVETRAGRVATDQAKTPISAHSTDLRNTREVSDVELVAMIYYNRAIDLLGEKRFDDAAAANAKALRLSPENATARGNLLATINNWAIDQGCLGHYRRAAELLRMGLTIEPGYEPFTLNYVHLCSQWSQRLCAEGRFDEALRLLVRAAAEQPGVAYFQQAQSDVSRRWSETAGQDATGSERP